MQIERLLDVLPQALPIPADAHGLGELRWNAYSRANHYCGRRAAPRAAQAHGRAGSLETEAKAPRAAVASFNLGVMLAKHGDLAGPAVAYRRAERRDQSDIADMARAALLELRDGG